MEAGDPQELTCSSCSSVPYEEEGPQGCWAGLGPTRLPPLFFFFFSLFFCRKEKRRKERKKGHEKL